MNSVEKQTVLHCLKSMIDEEVCEECPLYGMTGTDHCEKDCVRLAINALEQEPCNDCISRQAVLMEIDKYLCGVPFEEKGIDEVIKELPLVTPQPKMGRWIRELIRNEKGGCIGAKMICSECGNDNKHDEYMSYCPNCGAKMQEAE